MEKIKKMYFVGIKGVGMASLALIVKEAGLQVAGADIAEEFITHTELENIQIDIGFDPSKIDEFVGSSNLSEVLVIATAAHGGFENPQVVRAKEFGIQTITHGQAVGLFMTGELFNKKFIGISVSGAHGKTTTSAMAAVTFSKLGLDPTYTIGTSKVAPIGFGGHFGNGEYFIAEADEYFSELKIDRKPKFLYQHPPFLIINNIDFDHPDVYRDLEEVKKAYVTFANDESIEKVFVSDDEKLQSIVPLINKKIVVYGESDSSDYQLKNFEENGLNSKFEVYHDGISIGTFQLSVPGIHNAKNALAVISLCSELGFSPDQIAQSLQQFQGTKRRLEKVGEMKNGSIVYDDYAHHPKEIKTTLSALKQAYPDHSILVIFQPHTYTRTEALLSEFAVSFKDADSLILLPIFSSEREKELAENKKIGIQEELKAQIPNATFLDSPQSVVKYIQGLKLNPHQLIVTMGAGDVYKIAKQLI